MNNAVGVLIALHSLVAIWVYFRAKHIPWRSEFTAKSASARQPLLRQHLLSIAIMALPYFMADTWIEVVSLALWTLSCGLWFLCLVDLGKMPGDITKPQRVIRASLLANVPLITLVGLVAAISA